MQYRVCGVIQPLPMGFRFLSSGSCFMKKCRSLRRPGLCRSGTGLYGTLIIWYLKNAVHIAGRVKTGFPVLTVAFFLRCAGAGSMKKAPAIAGALMERITGLGLTCRLGLPRL